jgi:membrane protease YdiL (CAAX protease family)
MQPLESPAPEPVVLAAAVPQRSLFREVAWQWRDLLLGFAPLLLVRFTPALVRLRVSAAAPRWLWIPATLLATVWMLFYPLAICRRRLGRTPRPPRPRALLLETLVVLLVVPLLFAALTGFVMVLVLLFGPRAMPSNPLERITDSPNRFEPVILAIIAVGAAPLAEEAFFRGMFHNALRQRLPFAVAGALQAIVFGALHPFGLVSSIAIALLGFSFAALYEWRKTLLAPILLHASWNGLSLALLALGIAADANGPRLGVRVDSDERGCVITEVAPTSAAAEAGLRPGDVITTVDGWSVTSFTELGGVVRSKRVGDRVVIQFRRGGKLLELNVVLKGRQP